MTVLAQILFCLLVGLAICAAGATQRLNDRGFFHKRAYSRAPKNAFASALKPAPAARPLDEAAPAAEHST